MMDFPVLEDIAEDAYQMEHCRMNLRVVRDERRVGSEWRQNARLLRIEGASHLSTGRLYMGGGVETEGGLAEMVVRLWLVIGWVPTPAKKMEDAERDLTKPPSTET